MELSDSALQKSTPIGRRTPKPLNLVNPAFRWRMQKHGSSKYGVLGGVGENHVVLTCGVSVEHRCRSHLAL